MAMNLKICGPVDVLLKDNFVFREAVHTSGDAVFSALRGPSLSLVNYLLTSFPYGSASLWTLAASSVS
jgi:hypothetical protein